MFGWFVWLLFTYGHSIEKQDLTTQEIKCEFAAMVTPRILEKGIAPTGKVNCLIAMDDREEEIKDLGKRTCRMGGHVRPKAS